MSREPQLSIVSVLYGGAETLKETLPTWISAVAENEDLSVEVVLIDHSATSLAHEFGLDEWAQYVWNPVNPGFASGVNMGVSISGAERLLILNPDVYLDPASLRRIVEFQGADVAAVCLRSNGREHRGIEYTWWGFCKDRVSRDRTLVGPSGGAALVSRRAFVTSGGLPEHLFAWGEDAEWSLLIWQSGRRTLEVPVTLEHVGGHSVANLEGQRFKARLLARNRVATFRRLFSRRLQIALAIPFGAAMVLNGVRKFRSRTAAAYYSGVRDGLSLPLPPNDGSPIGVRDWVKICGPRRSE